MKKKIFSLFALLCLNGIAKPLQVTLTQEEKNEQQKAISITFNLNSQEKILKQTIKIASNSPHATLSDISFSIPATKQFLAEFKDSKEVFDQTFTIHLTATTDVNNHEQTKIYMSYLPLPQNKMEEKTFEINWNSNQKKAPTKSLPIHHKYQQNHAKTKKSYLESFQNIIQTTDNPWVRIFFIFLLGLLLSLTPCIYPMIPITIGILHRNGKQSILYNFLGSLSYATGLSTTFAIMGLLAALAGASFGNLLSQPIFVIFLTIFIGFMSLSMIGIFDLPTPSFMKNNATINSTFGPFLSAYLFGLLSGTIASPCVSPGLALVLTIVATIGNIIAGFWLLFAFGIGMSVPLIIIGTFSTSLQMLPRAGQWMVEIKKALGFVMLATCFYYLSNIFSPYIIMWILTLYLLFAALFYILDAQKSINNQTKTIKSLIGITLLALAVFIGYRTTLNKEVSTNTEKGVVWAKSYEIGLTQAKEQNKLLLLDFWANHCTICKAIDKKLFQKQLVAQGLEENIIFIKVDCSSSHNYEASNLKHQFSVFGQPAVLIVNPEDETILKQWSSEPYNMTPKEFVQAVKNIKK